MNIEDLDMVSNETDLYMVSSETGHMMNLIVSLRPKKQIRSSGENTLFRRLQKKIKSLMFPISIYLHGPTIDIRRSCADGINLIIEASND